MNATEITLIRAQTAEEQHIVRNLFVAYFYDLSQFDDNLIINEYGLPMWLPFGLPGPKTAEECATYNWWIRDKCLLYVIRVDGQPAGFAIVLADRNHLTPEVEYELMDFYIAPRYRRQGVGGQAAQQVFDAHRGNWQLFELDRNEPARRFWQNTLTDYTGGNFTNLDEGTQQRFCNRTSILSR